jgi:hypothetical protein
MTYAPALVKLPSEFPARGQFVMKEFTGANPERIVVYEWH